MPKAPFQVRKAKNETEAKANQAADSPWTERLARLGLAAQGTLYAMVGGLALLVAFHAGGKLTDRKGALQTVAAQPFGKILLGLLAVGLAGYALWRFLEAFLGRKIESREEEALWKRAGYLGRGLLYAGTFVITVLLITGSGGGGGGGKEEDRATAWVLDLPLGKWIVGAVGLAFLAAAGANGYQVLTQKFKEELKTGQMSAAEERWIARIGVFGHAARMVVFGLVGIFLIRAAIQYDPQEAIGLDGALRKVASADYGRYLLGAVAAGLGAYGLFCFLQARYRKV